ncbi:hypothetical protein SLL00_04905 [Metabacillus indicus]|uniref:hypothetical protein n=1 Tax=Metabacillus indicus TaxID=246786 RepID=UPI002A056985|nr:hypothetical protein [Metabacillus indicus]MDX8289116.1 hypothetical protein [Metabacillus indicus]
MGFPLTSYTVLKYIADGEEDRNRKNSTEMELALESLQEYSVFAFIIHDPTIHANFHRLLSKQFEDFHYSSGANLAFFGLVDSPYKLELEGVRPFYQDVREMVQLYEKQQNNKVDLSYSAFALANNLGISPEMLPAIVVTHDTRLKSFKYFQTDENVLDKQFNSLIGISNRMNAIRRNESLNLVEKQEKLFELLEAAEIKYTSHMMDGKISETLARSLSDIMSFLINSNTTSVYSPVKSMAKKQLNQAITKLSAVINHLKKEVNKSNIDEDEVHHLYPFIEELSIKLATFLRMIQLNKTEMDSMEHSTLVKTEWLDTFSQRYLQTGLDVALYLQSRNTSLDYSASVICLSKMFEKEINNSIVHWLRSQHQIELPDYYNKYQPGKTALISDVNLNKGNPGKWLPPELGRSKYIAEKVLNQEDWGEMGIENPKLLINNWVTIHRIRNKAAHSENVFFSDFTNVKKALYTLSSNKIFEQLYSLKVIYQGEKTI